LREVRRRHADAEERLSEDALAPPHPRQ
jgi:hypothetical protein